MIHHFLSLILVVECINALIDLYLKLIYLVFQIKFFKNSNFQLNQIILYLFLNYSNNNSKISLFKLYLLFHNLKNLTQKLCIFKNIQNIVQR